jgi:hypothetical protein
MSTIKGRGQIGPDGTFSVRLPELAGRDVEYTLDIADSRNGTSNGSGPHTTPSEDWRKFIRETAGSMLDFPDVERPGPDSYERREDF